MIKRLSHVCLSTRDLKKIIDFYCGLLSCEIVHEFRNQQGELYGIFILINNGTYLEFFQEQYPKPPGGMFRHLCLEVEDIHKFANVIREKGFNVEVSRGRTDKVLQFWINDPDGNQVEFHQYDQDSVQYQYTKKLRTVGS